MSDHTDTPHLAHHFATPKQQFESGKLGMWIFLATEVLMFGGLFCAYGVYRTNHPEIFIYAHQYLNKTLGGINTCVLICSSLTMAWAVRATQLNQRRLSVILMAATIAGGFGFMGIKFVEYKNKWEEGLLPGKHYKPIHHDEHGTQVPAAGTAHGTAIPAPQPPAHAEAKGETNHAAASAAVASAPASPDEPKIKLAAIGPRGLAHPEAIGYAHRMSEPRNVRIFFSVYFMMTGLHGIHVLVGMAVIAWIMMRAARGEFNAAYFLPVDLVGLYWHLVDLIWIFLFPLLYLIH